MTLGRLADAVADARRSITHADQSGDSFQRMVSRTTAADALHECGRRARAGELFADVERMQKEVQPECDPLYSARGFRYCDWLLAPADRAVRQVLPRGTGFQPVAEPHGQDGHATICADVERCGKRMFDWREEIAERGPTPLYFADIRLHRARLFRGWAEPAKARDLIEKHGYGRRKVELDDAEADASN